MRVLYVEDAIFLAEAVKHNLEKQGITVDHVNNGEDGLEKSLDEIYDCAVLDIMLPKLSGTDILKRMREKQIQTPVIMLSALSEVETKISNLEHGADDYLAKPFKTAELIARIKALVRRPKNININTISYSDLTLDKTNATLNGEQLPPRKSKFSVSLSNLQSFSLIKNIYWPKYGAKTVSAKTITSNPTSLASVNF